MKMLLGAQAVVLVFALWLNLWFFPSAITSGVKAISDSCGKTYPVEKVLSGNWFCPEKSDGE